LHQNNPGFWLPFYHCAEGYFFQWQQLFYYGRYGRDHDPHGCVYDYVVRGYDRGRERDHGHGCDHGRGGGHGDGHDHGDGVCVLPALKSPGHFHCCRIRKFRT
jgi:hypothetical protein